MNTREPREQIQTNPIQEEPSTASSTDPSTEPSTDPSTEPSTEPSTVTTEPSTDPSTDPSTEPSTDPSTVTTESSIQPSTDQSTEPSTVPSTVTSESSIPEELPPLTEMDIQQLRTKEKNIRSMILNKKPQCEIPPEESSTPTLVYIQKIQIKNELTNAEERITEVLKEHPTLHPFLNFQLPIKSIPISISTIDKSSIKKCSEEDIHELFTIEPTKEPLIQTTYKKIGDSLFDYLRTSIEKPQYFLQVLVDSHIHLLNSISKLQSNSINHFHLTEENILYDEINAIPVISDFRMAFTKDELEGEQTNELFPVYDESLIWSIEIYVLSQLIENTKQEVFTQEVMEGLLEQFISSYVFTPFRIEDAKSNRSTHVAGTLNDNWNKNLFNENQLQEFHERMKLFFGKYINRLHTEVIADLKKYAPSWDMFSLSMLYLLFINEIHGTSSPSPSTVLPSFMEKYKTILINSVLSDPDKRPSISFLKESIENTFSNISQQELNEYFINVLKINQQDESDDNETIESSD